MLAIEMASALVTAMSAIAKADKATLETTPAALVIRVAPDLTVAAIALVAVAPDQAANISVAAALEADAKKKYCNLMIKTNTKE